jgi:exopolyphosphatase / guanosine-5'-triphosphate,3'-diphosphate pyrophosphatase
MMSLSALKENLNREIILALADKYADGNIRAHGENVAGYALKIFDCLAETTNLSTGWRNILEQSALIHDIGHCINEKDHDRHTHYLIMHDALMDGIPDNTRSLLAQVAGSHRLTLRKSMKKQNTAVQGKALQLISFLRIADTLDYPYLCRAEVKYFDWYGKKLIIALGEGDIKAVRKRLEKRGQLFRQLFGHPLVVSHYREQDEK